MKFYMQHIMINFIELKNQFSGSSSFEFPDSSHQICNPNRMKIDITLDLAKIFSLYYES